MDDIRLVVKENLKFYRNQRGLTQQRLAEACGVTTPYIGEVEIGRKYVSLQLVETMADVLHVEPWKLFLPALQRDQALPELLAEELRESIYAAVGQVLGQKNSNP